MLAGLQTPAETPTRGALAKPQERAPAAGIAPSTLAPHAAPEPPYVFAVVVAHEPDHDRLVELAESLHESRQMRLLFVDNSESDAGRAVVSSVAAACRSEVICNGRNLGVAEAQNVGIRAAVRSGSPFVLLLDQDSVIDAGSVFKMVEEFHLLRARGIQVGAIGPRVVDTRSQTPMPFVRLGRLRMKRLEQGSDEAIACDLLISSGCLISLDALLQVGLMDSEFFIDYVDMEWCARARAAGFTMIGLPMVRMRHSLGEATLKVAGREIALHTPVRSYYMVRNALLFARKPYLSWRWRTHLIYRAIGHVGLFTVMFPRRLQRLKWMSLGALDGLRGRSGRLGGPDGLGRRERSAGRSTTTA